MFDETVLPTFGITRQSIQPQEVCIRALADWAARLGKSTQHILKVDGEIWYARGNGSCMFHSDLNNNNPETAHTLRLILADFDQAELDFQLPGLDMAFGKLIGGQDYPERGI